MPCDPFQFEFSSYSPLTRAAAAAARPLLTWALRLEACRTLYQQASIHSEEPFDRRVLRLLNIAVDVSVDDVALIPPAGALLVAANHPHGALDGLLMADVLRRIRPDVRILTNHLLARVPELADLCFFVDPFDGPDAASRSRPGLRSAHLWLRGGGALVVFPSGEVAHTRRGDGSRTDSEWKPTVGRLALATRARVVPAFIDGANSQLFYAAGRVHPALRTLLLARELLAKGGETVTVRLGAPIASQDLEVHCNGAAIATEQIRSEVDRLAGKEPALPSVRAAGMASGAARTDAIGAEISLLPSEICLVESGALRVFCAEGKQIPATLREIGHLRAQAYRAVGEGTGADLDLDAFDQRYLHLFSWDQTTRQIVGAYRIGQTDRIVAAHGVDGLYTRTLFGYDERLIQGFRGPALELGRSFVRIEYQKNHNALLLLWKGIAQFVARHPEYRVLFGPVSISSRYSDASHRLLMAFLEQNHFDRELAQLVAALNPSVARPPTPQPTAPKSIDEANRLVSQIEADGKGIPVLLRQYLKLNARLIGFNVDPDFGNALDALMMVDLTAVDPTILNRYFGRLEAARFLALHQRRPAHAA